MQFGEGKIGSKFVVGPKIGSGSFGQVYLVNALGTDQVYALKRQDQKSKQPQLQTQAKILKNIEGAVGFSKVHWQGCEFKSNIMVIDLLGPTVEDLFAMCNRKFSMKTVYILADQILQRIEWLHSKDYIHRDIKPQNFLMGLAKKSHIVHLIDFGLSKKYRDSKTHQHIPYKQNKNLTGTARYASINAHLGIEESRRDDLQSIGYMLVYLAQGYLPWQGVRANNKMEKYQKIMEKKMNIPVEVQCRHLPIQFSIYLNYCRSLKFQDKPNYIYLKNLFQDLMERQKVSYDYAYDWCSLNQQRQLQSKIKIEIRKPFVFEDSAVQLQKVVDLSINNPAQEEQLLSGEQNIEDSMLDISDGDAMHNRNDKNLEDLEQKKNKLIFDQ